MKEESTLTIRQVIEKSLLVLSIELDNSLLDKS
jgi:hypothetical protein